MSKSVKQLHKDSLQNNSCPVPHGVLVVIGGKENMGDEKETNGNKEHFIRLEVLKTFTGLIHRKEPVLEVITTATSQPDEYFREYKKCFHDLGISHVNKLHHNSRQEAMDDELQERVDAADAFFFTGGNQLLLTSIYGGTPFLTRLKERYIQNRIVIGGTSAGAMALSTPMIYAGSKEVEQTTGTIKVTTGLEFIKDVCIDTHFVERSRFIRMAQVVATNPTSIGMGVEEDTALVVRNGLEAEVVGNGTVIVIDGFSLSSSNVEEFVNNETISIRDLRVHILGRGEKYSIPQINPPHK